MSGDKAMEMYDKLLVEELGKTATKIYMRPKGFGITITEYLEQFGTSYRVARDRLEAKIKSGEYDKHRMLMPNHGGVSNVYHRKADWPPQEK